MPTSEHFWTTVKKYIGPGNKVLEMYHGERDDVLRGLAKIVGGHGIVYGVDRYNPFEKIQHMKDLQNLPQVKLLNFLIPPLPSEVSALDAIIIREFIFTYPPPYNGIENPETYRAIDAAIKFQGHLIIHLNPTEQKNEQGKNSIYHGTIRRQLPAFEKMYDNEDALVYQKTGSETPPL